MFGSKEKTEIPVEGMSCGHCEKRVEEAVGKFDGVKSVKANHSSCTVEIKFAKGVELDRSGIEAAITELGFTIGNS